MGSQHKKKKKTPDVNVVVADIQDNLDQQATKAAIQPAFEGTSYMYALRSSLDFVNVTETIDAAQTGGGAPDVTPPAAVIGLIATAASDTVISLNWTANTEPDLNHYNVYRGTSTGFVVTLGVTVPVGTPSTNSYSDTGRTASTTYYYRVSAVDASGNIGPLSTEANATTLAPGAFLPSLELHLDSSFNDSSPNAHPISGVNGSGFILPGKFGSAGWKCNVPDPGTGAGAQDNLTPDPFGNPSSLQMDTTIGFSVSLWINPQDLSALSFRRSIYERVDDANNNFQITIDSAGIVYFFVKKAGTVFKRQKTGFTTGSWQHLAATFNGATNALEIYRDAVAGASSTATVENPTTLTWTSIGARPSGGDGDNSNTYYEGYFDEIRYYKSVVLTPTQVTNLKNTNGP